MKKGYKVCLIVIITLLVISTSLATSYSLWIVTDYQKGENLIIAGCFDMTYEDIDENRAPNDNHVHLDNAFPMSDELGMIQPKSYKVTITNSCDIDANYKLVISDTAYDTLDVSNIRYYLTNSAGTNFAPAYLNALEPHTMDSAIKGQVETDSGVTLKNSYILASGVLKSTENITYEFRMWVKDDATNDTMEKIYDAVISYEAFATKSQEVAAP